MTGTAISAHIAAWLYIASAVYLVVLGIEWIEKRIRR